MPRAARAARRVGATLAVAMVASCGGERVRLGDGPEPSAASGGNAGGSVAQGGSSGGTPGTGGSAGEACERGRIRADEVVWIGDSWVTIPGLQHTKVRDYARAAGAIGMDDDYVVLAAAATTIATIASQYDGRQAGPTKVKVLIMDGGTWDTIVANGSDSSVARVLSAFEQHLEKVANDATVEHIIYYLPPELPTIAGVSALRPGLAQACAASSVPCHFLDLDPLWAGHDEYTAPDGIQASEAGASVIAEQLWAIMRAHCVAQ